MTEGILEGYDFPQEHAIPLGTDRATGKRVQLHDTKLNRHGTICGATGSGKTRTLQGLAEWLSERGVPLLINDAKGDLSGLSVPGELSKDMRARAEAIGQGWWEATSIPTEYIALGGVGSGVPAKINVKSLGWRSLARLVGMTPAQATGLGTVFGALDNDSSKPTETLSDLMSLVNGMKEDPDISLGEAMGNRINDKLGLFDRENPGLFGGPEFDIMDFIRRTDADIDEDGYDNGSFGYVSIIDSSVLMDTPEILTTFLVWVLDQLVKHLPEVGDDELVLVVALDECHLLFTDASKEFIKQFTNKIKRLRSKGVGILLCSQQLSDIPEDILAQCGLRIQHVVRVLTPKQRRGLKATVDTFPISHRYSVEAEMTGMPTGSALVCIVDEKGQMTEPSVCQMYIPRTSMSPIPEEEVQAIVRRSDLNRKYRRMEFEHAERIRLGRVAAAPRMREASGIVMDEDALRTAMSYGMDEDDVAAVVDHIQGAEDAKPRWGV